MGRKLGYARVSTKDQKLELKIDSLIEAGVEERDIFKEKITGSKKERPALEQLMEYVEPGDTIVVWKLDRMGRSIRHLIELMEHFKEQNIAFVSLQENIDTSSTTGKLIFNIFASFSEFERDMIIQRTKAGLEAARARGNKGGRPKKDEAAIKRALKLYHSKEYSIKEIAEMTGVSKATLFGISRKKLRNNSQLI
ncbi:recombinase family protein [Rossellomorea aquimaris]|uniref:recombinase family protein n=1 Tax=Rossellomorea aquimaris TaxID=189382 RepID=UPI0011E9590C|nr:recombinase family protein [Rossellomorea aquimaris]TYS87722.1 recombinase family protein [Rossellomorea aquimaris]